MPFPTVLKWLMLAIGVLCLVGGIQRWRIGGKSQVLIGALCLTQFVSTSENPWLRYPALGLLSIPLFWVLVRSFSERDRVSLWINLPFLVIASAIGNIEIFSDDLNWWQFASMAAVAVLSTAGLATVIVRLTRRRPTTSAAL